VVGQMEMGRPALSCATCSSRHRPLCKGRRKAACGRARRDPLVCSAAGDGRTAVWQRKAATLGLVPPQTARPGAAEATAAGGARLLFGGLERAYRAPRTACQAPSGGLGPRRGAVPARTPELPAAPNAHLLEPNADPAVEIFSLSLSHGLIGVDTQAPKLRALAGREAPLSPRV